MRLRDDYRRLVVSLEGPDYQELLNRLQNENPIYKRFSAWSDAIALMRKGTSGEPVKDEVLRPILRAHAADGNHRWRRVLLLIFWPALVAIHSRRRHWDPNSAELWQRLYWCFHRVICRVDFRKRPHRLVQKIYNDTVHRLHDEYQREWYRQAVSEDLDLVSGLREPRPFDPQAAFEAEIKHLRRYMDEGRISDTDFLIIAGTRVYGYSLTEAAQRLGLNYEAAKKRRQRAECAIRRFEGKSA